MKMSRVFLVLGFVLIMALYSDAELPAIPETCCYKFFLGNIPPQNILNVQSVGPECPLGGFIVTTPKFPGLCVREDPRKK